jgi:hypothetical protein
MSGLITVPTQQILIPVFAPVAILENVTQLTPGNYVAFRCATDVNYRLNGTGTYVTIPAGTIMGIAKNITSIDFQASVAAIEVM